MYYKWVIGTHPSFFCRPYHNITKRQHHPPWLLSWGECWWEIMSTSSRDVLFGGDICCACPLCCGLYGGGGDSVKQIVQEFSTNRAKKARDEIHGPVCLRISPFRLVCDREKPFTPLTTLFVRAVWRTRTAWTNRTRRWAGRVRAMEMRLTNYRRCGGTGCFVHAVVWRYRIFHRMKLQHCMPGTVFILSGYENRREHCKIQRKINEETLSTVN